MNRKRSDKVVGGRVGKSWRFINNNLAVSASLWFKETSKTIITVINFVENKSF